MKNKKLILLSLIASLVMHLLLAIAVKDMILNKYRNFIIKPPKQYFVDIITLPKQNKTKIVTKKEKHKIAANIQRKGIAKKYNKKEKIPLKTVKATPKIIEKLKKEEKMQNKTEMIISKNKNTKKTRIKKKNNTEKPPAKKQKRQIKTKQPETIKVAGGLYNPKAVLSNKTRNGFLTGTSKRYQYKNTKREATVSIGTQSLKYASYMQHIKDKIENVWIYPEDARMNNQQGQLLILFSIDKNGNLAKVQLIRSSGYASLDNAAIEAVKEAAPFPPLPKRLHIDKLNIYATFLYTLSFYYVE